MKKSKTLNLKAKTRISKGNQTPINEIATRKQRKNKVVRSSELISEDPTIKLLKPFLHKEQTSKTYLYLGKKVKILLSDL